MLGGTSLTKEFYSADKIFGSGWLGMIVPERYWRACGLDHHQFLVRNCESQSYTCFTDGEGRILREFAEAAYCELRVDDDFLPILVPKKELPSAFEAIILIGNATRWLSKSRVEKYLTVHKAYECLAPRRDPELSAIRHGLTHPGTTLTEPRTVAVLTRLFGSTTIDLQSYRHARIFYCQLGRLLIETDILLHAKLIKNLWRLRRIEGLRQTRFIVFAKAANL